MNLLKNLNLGGLLVLVVGVVLMVSWKNSTNTVDEDTWYEITVTDISDPDNDLYQQIDRIYPGGSPSGSCNTLPGLTCAVLVDGELDENLLPMTVADADSLGFNILDHRQKQ